MKTLTVLCLFLAAAYAYPGKIALSDEVSDSDESVLVNPMMKGMPSVVEVDVGDSGEDTFFFPSFFRPLFVNPFPQFKFGGFSNLFPSSFFGGWNSFFSGIPSDAKVTNSTSTTKIVDGHKITVNATTYENEKNGAVYKYEVIEVSQIDQPSEEGVKSGEEPVKGGDGEEATTNAQVPEETSSAANDNNSFDNEIRKEETKRAEWELRAPKFSAHFPESNYGNFHQRDYVDLRDDIRVNVIAEEAARRSGSFSIPEDVEVFAPPAPNGQLSKYRQPPHFLAQFAYQNHYNRRQNLPHSSEHNYQINYQDSLSHPNMNAVQYYPQNGYFQRHPAQQIINYPHTYNYY